MKEKNPINPLSHALRTFLMVIGLVVLYAYAVQVTDIDLQVVQEPRRQESVTNVLRLLAQPDIFARDEESSAIVGFSETSYITFNRMVETVLMALMASTIGTVLAVPVSFLAARNLMIQVTAPLASIMAALVALPIGGWLVGQVAALLMAYSAQVSESVWQGVGAMVLATAVSWPVLRLGPPLFTHTERPWGDRLVALVRLVAGLSLLYFALGLLAHLGTTAGDWLDDQLGAFGFVGNFVVVSADVIRLLLPSVMGLIGALIAASLGGRYGQEAVLRLPETPARLLTGLLAVGGTAVFVYGVGSGLVWLYQFDNPQNWTTIPAAIGAVVGGVVGLMVKAKRPFAIGFFIYTFSRGLLNALRSIEPIIMGVVFVVWVGLGPFAGILALTLHSIAALGKLFSEQVESIAEGPVEAITATGANRIQTIVYAVIPQIIPPYIAFTVYRWDINVRMSTIIGFVGGGGIGFVLQQNINLLRYRQASVMMLAIAVVVALLDYASSRVRRRII